MIASAPRSSAFAVRRLPAWIGATALAALLAGCSSTSGGSSSASAGSGGGNVFTNLLFYGGTTVPPEAPEPVDTIECPAIEITEGGSALRLGGAEATSVRHQITIGQTARECQPLPSGAYSLKIGVEGRVLLGPAGSPGRVDAPVRIRVTRGDTVIADRAQRVPVTIGGNETQGTFVVIEQGIVVQPGPGAVKITIGLETGGRAPARQTRRR